MRATACNRLHLHVEGVRLGDNPGAAQVVLDWGKGEAVHLTVQAGQLDGQVHVARSNRLVVAEGIDVELGLDTVLENGHFNGEIAVAQHAAMVRSALIIRGGGGVLTLGRGGWPVPTGAERQSGGQ